MGPYWPPGPAPLRSADLLTTFTHQPNLNTDFEAYARYVSTTNYLVDHLVRAIGTDGNPDPTPSTRTFTLTQDAASPVEGETLTVPPTGTDIVNDAMYSGGRALKAMDNTGISTKRVTLTKSADVVLMARGGQTGGPPTLVLVVDVLPLG